MSPAMNVSGVADELALFPWSNIDLAVMKGCFWPNADLAERLLLAGCCLSRRAVDDP